MFANAKVGDRVVRIRHAYKGDEEWRNEGEIVAIEGRVIIARIQVDYPRPMVFFMETGISIGGERYGRLESAPEQS